MALYDFRCLECEYQFEHKLPIPKRNRAVACPECKGKTKRLVLGTKNWSFAEGWRQESSRSNSYFENAEKCRLARQKKSLEQHAEKMHYDKAYRDNYVKSIRGAPSDED